MQWFASLAVGTLLCTAVFTTPALADTPKEFKDQEAIMEKFFKAYNKGDAKGCFENYIDAFKGMAEQLYPALVKPHKDKYGDYKSHTFVKEGSVTADDITLLILQVDFDKEKKVKVGINFGKEGKTWKIQQVTFGAP
ncbi:MAG: hypothetical protein QM703_26060 [Gemmatales bacterium]